MGLLRPCGADESVVSAALSFSFSVFDYGIFFGSFGLFTVNSHVLCYVELDWLDREDPAAFAYVSRHGHFVRGWLLH